MFTKVYKCSQKLSILKNVDNVNKYYEEITNVNKC